MEQLLYTIGLILFISIVIVYAFNRIKLPPMLGFFIAGALIGPYGFKFVSDYSTVELLAELGVIFLLFIIGIEFSLTKLFKLKKVIFLGGSIQVFGTIIITSIILINLGFYLNKAIFIGFLVSLSSTAVAMKLLQMNRQVDAPHGRNALGISIFQDIMVVPMLMFLPILAGVNKDSTSSVLQMSLKLLVLVVFVVVSAKWIVPFIFYQITKTRIKELFLLTTILLCLAIVGLFEYFGLSLAIGAFIAGLLISESEYNQEAIANITPFRDVFSSFFFVSIGMLLDLQFLINNWLLILVLVIFLVIIKTTITTLACLISDASLRTSLHTALILFHIAEFSFVISLAGIQLGLIDQETYQKFLGASIISIAIAPFAFQIAPSLAQSISCWRIFQKYANRQDFEEIKSNLENHIIIIGFGINGRNVAKAAKIAGIPYIILEMNPMTVKQEKLQGEPIYYADASNREILEHCKIEKARILVVAISDPISSERITSLAKKLNPGLYIIVRTRYVGEMQALYKAGADEVIPEEFETSIEIFVRVLNKYLIPKSDIEKFVNQIRASGYEMFRSLSFENNNIQNLKVSLPEYEISVYDLPENSQIVGKSLAELDIRQKYSITLLAIRRGSEQIINPSGEVHLEANDQLILFGKPEKIYEFIEYAK